MSKYYTIGEVLDTLKFGEVAVKVSCELDVSLIKGDSHYYSIPKVGVAFHYDKNDGGRFKIYGKDSKLAILNTGKVEYFNIISEEEYLSML